MSKGYIAGPKLQGEPVKQLKPGFREHLFSCRNGHNDNAPCCTDVPAGHIKCNWCGGYHDGSMTFGGIPVLACPEVPNDGNLHSIDMKSFANAYGRMPQGYLQVWDGLPKEDRSNLIYAGNPTDEEAKEIYGLLAAAPVERITDTWTCENHAPGLEVEDIPIDEVCGACGYGKPKEEG